jgi:hypothetical protein
MRSTPARRSINETQRARSTTSVPHCGHRRGRAIGQPQWMTACADFSIGQERVMGQELSRRLDPEKRFSVESPRAPHPSSRPWFQHVARCAPFPPRGSARRPFAEGGEGPAAPRPIRVVSRLAALLSDVPSSHAHPRASASRPPNRRPLRISLRAVRHFHWLQDRQGPIRGSPLHPVMGPPTDPAPIERSICKAPSGR